MKKTIKTKFGELKKIGELYGVPVYSLESMPEGLVARVNDKGQVKIFDINEYITQDKLIN